LARNLSSLAPHDEAQKKLIKARRKAFQASVAAAQREALALVQKDRFQAASAVVQNLKKELASEAKDLGTEREKQLTQVVDSYGFLADLALQAGRREPE
jgi:CHASE3 domain sensor protein